MRCFPFSRTLAAAFLLWLAAPELRAEVHHCVTPDGRSVFTDRECHLIGATEQPPGTPVDRHTLRPSGCARTVQELSFEITMAIDAHDTNRLANVYHWAGMTSGAAHGVWQRLDAIAQRPLVDIVPIAPDVAASAATSRPPAAMLLLDEEGTPMPSPPPSGPASTPASSMRKDPVAFRLEQTLGDSVRPASTTVGLVRHFDCWWVRF